jgi:hypothetical protein
MLVLLAQASHDYRAHLACGVLRDHGVEAHVFHDNSGVLHGGASTTTASLWVQDDEWQDAREILATAPIESLPEGDSTDSMNIPKENLPPPEAVALGVAASIFIGSAMVILAAMAPTLATFDLTVMFQGVLALVLALLVQAVNALGLGLAVGLMSAIVFPVIRWHQDRCWPAVALMACITCILAICVATCGIH